MTQPASTLAPSVDASGRSIGLPALLAMLVMTALAGGGLWLCALWDEYGEANRYRLGRLDATAQLLAHHVEDSLRHLETLGAEAAAAVESAAFGAEGDGRTPGCLIAADRARQLPEVRGFRVGDAVGKPLCGWGAGAGEAPPAGGLLVKFVDGDGTGDALTIPTELPLAGATAGILVVLDIAVLAGITGHTGAGSNTLAGLTTVNGPPRMSAAQLRTTLLAGGGPSLANGETVHAVVRTPIRPGLLAMATMPVDMLAAPWLFHALEHTALSLAAFVVMMLVTWWWLRSNDGRYRSELQSGLAQKDLLLRELNHRIRNNLHAVASLVQLQQHRHGNAPADPAITAIRDQVTAICLVHDALSSGDLSGRLALDDYLVSLGRHAGVVYGAHQRGVSIDIDTCPVEVDADRAMVIGIIVNELLTNAFKHAFPRGRGRLWINLRHTAEGYAVTVADDGCGMRPAGPRPAGMGMSLVRSLASQSGAQLSLDQAHGTSITIAWPA